MDQEMHSVYIRDINWWEYRAPSAASWGWRKICKAKEIMKSGYSANNSG